MTTLYRLTCAIYLPPELLRVHCVCVTRCTVLYDACARSTTPLSARPVSVCVRVPWRVRVCARVKASTVRCTSKMHVLLLVLRLITQTFVVLLLVLARPERVPENPSGSVPDMSHVLLPPHAPPLARRPSPSPSPPRLTVAVCRSPPSTPLAVSPLARALPSPQNSLSSSQRRLPYSHSGRTRRRRSCRRGSSRPRRRAWP